MTGKVELLTPSGGKVILDPTNTAVDRVLTLPATGATLLTDSAGILNIGSGQVVKDASGNVGVGISYGLSRLTVAGQSPGGDGAYATGRGSIVLNETNRTSVNETGGLELKTSVFGSGYGAKIMALDNGSLVIGNRDNSATYAERMRIDTSGNVGIGTSTPSSLTHLSKSDGTAYNGSATDGQLSAGATLFVQQLANANNLVSQIAFQSRSGQPFNRIVNSGGGAPFMAFVTNNTERARIDASGDVIIGATTKGNNGGKLHVEGLISAAGTVGRQGINGTSNGNTINFFWSGSSLQAFVDTTNIGNVQVISDYRIKQKIAAQTINALDRVMQLRPISYEFQNYKNLFKADGVLREGFIAHELAEIIPSAVDGVKDDESQIQSLKLDALCSVLTKAIQELKAELDTVKAELNTLKGN